MKVEQFKENLEQILQQVKYNILIYESSNNNELKIATQSLKSEQEQLEIIIDSMDKATKWDDQQTQTDLELAAAVNLYFKQTAERHSIALENGGIGKVIAFNKQELIDWYREQKRGVE